MRILVFAHDSSLYGASQSLFTLLTNLNHEFLVLLPYQGKLEALLTVANIKHKIVDYPRAANQKPEVYTISRRVKDRLKYEFRLRKVLPQIKQLTIDFDPQLIYTNTSVVTVGYTISR